MLNVLLIEDEDFMHEVLDSFIAHYARKHALKIDIKALHDPVQGLLEATLNGDHYDLILLDMRLPKLTGDRIYTALVNNNPAMADRILFVTSYSQEVISRLADEKLRILDKPFQYAKFESTVSVMLT